jgi:broad specificity phosphatase PhoE
MQHGESCGGDDSFARLRIDNASLTIVEVQSGQASLVVFNDTCHLQAR